MTPGDHVRAVHLIAEKNPMRDMASFLLGAHSARAEVGSNIPVLRFFFRAEKSGELEFWWLDDEDVEGGAKARLTVTS